MSLSKMQVLLFLIVFICRADEAEQGANQCSQILIRIDIS